MINLVQPIVSRFITTHETQEKKHIKSNQNLYFSNVIENGLILVF